MIRRLSDLAARGLVAALLAVLITAGLTTAASAQPRVLSNSDRLSYTNAYDALRRGDLDTARASARQADDRVLLGQVEFERLFHPDHVSSFEELSAWLEEYADLPEAPRVYALALRRRPDGAPEPRRPRRVDGRTWESLTEAEKEAILSKNMEKLLGLYGIGWAVPAGTGAKGYFKNPAAGVESFDKSRLGATRGLQLELRLSGLAPETDS